MNSLFTNIKKISSLYIKSFSLPLSISNILKGKDRKEKRDIFDLDSLLCFLPKKGWLFLFLSFICTIVE